MILEIENNKGERLATIKFAESNVPDFIGKYDQEFFDFVSKIMERGEVPVFVDVPEKEGVLSIIEQVVYKNDPNFSLAFKEFLEREGYDVVEKHPDIEREIQALLAGFPDDNKYKQDILPRLSEMSHLEQTIILEGLKKINKIEE